MKGCKFLSDNEIKSIIKVMNKQKSKLLVLISLNFGTRISETLSLNFEDVSGSFVTIRSSKGSNTQSFPINKILKDAIKATKQEYLSKGWNVNPDTALFLSQSGVRMTRQAASYIIKTAAKEANIEGKVNSHSFRKSFVNHIYKETNYNILETKQYSRHKSLSNLEYYIETTNSTNLVNNITWGA